MTDRDYEQWLSRLDADHRNAPDDEDLDAAYRRTVERSAEIRRQRDTEPEDGPFGPPTDMSAIRATVEQEPRPVTRKHVHRISVFLLDDHDIVRRGLRQLLEYHDIDVVGEAATTAEALAIIPTVRPQVAILDVRLPDGDGVGVCREIRSAIDPPPACLILTSFSDDEALFGAILAGASGYMLKQASGNDLVSAVRTIAAGGSLHDAGVTATVMERLRAGQREDNRYSLLSQQERKILDLIAQGMTNRQIATELFLAEKTVKNYVSTLLHKLGFDRRTEAAVYATRRNQGNRL